MAWSGGSFTRVHDWTADAGSAINIEASRMDAEDDNFETGIDSCLHKGGQNTATGNLPMGGNRHTGVGNTAAKDDYASAADVIDQDLTYYVDSGSANTYVITPSPSVSAYEEGQRVVFRAQTANTGASTLNVNSLGAIAIQTNEGNALTANMIIAGGYYECTYDANGTRFVLTSPDSLARVTEARTVSGGEGLTGGGALSSNLTIDMDVDGLTEQTGIDATNDYVVMYDASGVVHLKCTIEDLNAASGDAVPTSRIISAGFGLTGGGDLTTNRFFDVGAGTGIDVNANDVALDTSNSRNADHGAISISSGTGLTGGGTIASTRTLSLSHLGLESLADPNADRIAFWDDSAAAFKWLTAGDNLTITATTLDVTGLGSLATQSTVDDTDWGSTDLAVGNGGTGSSTASGAATNLGLGTGDSPQFTGVNVGHATDTTITRATSGGQIEVEGDCIFSHQSGTYTSAKIHINTGTPSGGNDGDIWLEREA